MHCASVESYLVQVLQTLEYKCASAGTSRNEGQFLARLARLSALFPPLGKATAVLFAFLHKKRSKVAGAWEPVRRDPVSGEWPQSQYLMSGACL